MKGLGSFKPFLMTAPVAVERRCKSFVLDEMLFLRWLREGEGKMSLIDVLTGLKAEVLRRGLIKGACSAVYKTYLPKFHPLDKKQTLFHLVFSLVHVVLLPKSGIPTKPLKTSLCIETSVILPW